MIHVSHPIAILYGGGVGLACGLDGELRSDELHGLFAGDTRVLSTYRLTIAGFPWRMLSRSRPSPSTAQWDLQNPAIRTPAGDLLEGDVHLRVRRRVLGALHDDLAVTSFADRTITARLVLQLDSDFADLFEVKDRTTKPRVAVRRAVRDGVLTLEYQHADFKRALHVKFTSPGSSPLFIGTQVVFDLVLEPRTPWRCCITAVPELDGNRLELSSDPHTGEAALPTDSSVVLRAPEILAGPFRRGCVDLEHLAIPRRDGGPFIAAGAPWFLALFGRDMLVTSLMAELIGSWHSEGALAALEATQAHTVDPYRDASPGKIAHELRHGELAHFGVIPHSPYYGTHDAPELYVLALWNAYRWTGRKSLLEEYLPAAEEAMRWCREAGDEDGDGFLEYRTHSRAGYRNQGWKDAGDAIPHVDGTHAELPIATVELQGYWYAAQLAMAELYAALGDRRAQACREAARELRQNVERRFWLEEEGCYALALDGAKREVRSVSSNPGHLLWCGLPSRIRAERVARRLLAPDMFSGYGVRTLSAEHRSYNPLSYQRGSVWPHDNALIAAGLARYGLHDEAARILEGIFSAAHMFDDDRLPELFCGFAREEGPPVAYEKANVPQAWAAAAPILAVQVFLGLVPDVPAGRCYLAPWLPPWLPELAIRGIAIGGASLDVTIARGGAVTKIVHASHPTLEILRGAPLAPLWGSPIDAR